MSVIDQNKARRQRRMAVAIVSVASIAAILFVCIFSLYHLPTRNPVETPEYAVDDNAVSSPAGDIEETNDILEGSQENASNMIGTLEMDYQNAALNGEPYEAEQAGMRLALTYMKAGENTQAKSTLEKLIETYPYDNEFVGYCNKLLQEINKKGNQ